MLIRRAGGTALIIAALVVAAAIAWAAMTASGNPDPTVSHLSPGAVILDSGLLVFREGLEAILVLAAITASFVGERQTYRRPVAAGSALALATTVVTWFVAILVIGAVNAPSLDIQAASGLLAIAVLLLVMNWFFHRVYWTGWIAHHNSRRQRLLAMVGDERRRALLGFGLLGFTAIYREGFEVVLFLQNLRLQAGSTLVLAGVAVGLAFTAVVGAVTFVAHHRLPYRKMLVLTGVLLGVVLVVMVGESAQELQLAGWLPTTTLNLPIPDWVGVWFAVFPTAQTLSAQALAAAVVLLSYGWVELQRSWLPRRRAAAAAVAKTR